MGRGGDWKSEEEKVGEGWGCVEGGSIKEVRFLYFERKGSRIILGVKVYRFCKIRLNFA